MLFHLSRTHQPLHQALMSLGIRIAFVFISDIEIGAILPVFLSLEFIYISNLFAPCEIRTTNTHLETYLFSISVTSPSRLVVFYFFLQTAILHPPGWVLLLRTPLGSRIVKNLHVSVPGTEPQHQYIYRYILSMNW